MANYLDKEKTHEIFKKWLIENPDGSNMPNEVGEAILLVANNYIPNYWKFIGYTQDWKEEMIDAAVMSCVKYVKNYKYEQYENPHTYLTMICYHSARSMIPKLKKRQNNKVKMIIDTLEDVKLDERFSDIDPEVLKDLYSKIEDHNPDPIPTDKEKINDWMDEMIGIFEMEVEDNESTDT